MQILRKGRKPPLVILFFSINTIALAQKIEIKGDSLFVNSEKITKQTTLKSLENFLGKPDRKFSKANTIWTYDNLGLMIYIDPSNSMLRSIEFEFKKENFDFTPRKTYQGSFMIYGANISEKTSIANLKEIKELNFEYSVLQMYSFTTSYLLLTLEYSDNMTRLESVGIAFKE